MGRVWRDERFASLCCTGEGLVVCVEASSLGLDVVAGWVVVWLEW